MLQTKEQEQLINSICTKEYADSTAEIIDDIISKNLFSLNFNYKSTADLNVLLSLIDSYSTSFSDAFSSVIKAVITLHAQELTSKEQIQRLLTEIKTLLVSADVVKVLVSMPLDVKFVAKLHSWFQELLSEPLLLHVDIDPSILGGIIVTYKGLYRDYSLAKKLDTYFVSTPAYVLQLLK